MYWVISLRLNIRTEVVSPTSIYLEWSWTTLRTKYYILFIEKCCCYIKWWRTETSESIICFGKVWDTKVIENLKHQVCLKYNRNVWNAWNFWTLRKHISYYFNYKVLLSQIFDVLEVILWMTEIGFHIKFPHL